MRIGELSNKTDVSRDTLRLYEKLGLINSVRRGNGYRDFDSAMIRLVDLIRLGQKLGFKLHEMKSIAEVISNRELGADETAKLLRQKLEEVDQKIGEMSQLRSLLAGMLDQVCPLQS